ncbi:MAG TPA: AAA family ATPase [Candidatus Nanopusillus sp.]|nr:AAA family ATPase [Candidatus Nanopusillus sp.]
MKEGNSDTMDVEHIAVLGMTGTGKTYFIKDLIRRAKSKGKKIVILDLERDYHDVGAFTLKDWRNIGVYKDKKQVLRILTEDYEDGQVQDKIYNYIFRNMRNWIVVIDEVHNQGGHQSKLSSSLKKLITRGRKRGLKLIVASQRPSLIDKTILSNCAVLVLKKVGWDTDWSVYRAVNKEVCDLLKNSTNKYATVILRYGTIWKKML